VIIFIIIRREVEGSEVIGLITFRSDHKLLAFGVTSEWKVIDDGKKEVFCDAVGTNGAFTLHFDSEVTSFTCSRNNNIKRNFCGSRRQYEQVDMRSPTGFDVAKPVSWEQKVKPILKILLYGTIPEICPDSMLQKLRGQTKSLLKYIVDMSGADYDPSVWGIVPDQAHTVAQGVRFPPPTGIQINMLPFIIGDRTSLPEEFHGYWPVIMACNVDPSYSSKVGYLTVHESLVAPGKTQRRGGGRV
jgi:hypothetical protein